MPRKTLHLPEQAEHGPPASPPLVLFKREGNLGEEHSSDQDMWSGNKEVPWNFTSLKNHVMDFDPRASSLILSLMIFSSFLK